MFESVCPCKECESDLNYSHLLMIYLVYISIINQFHFYRELLVQRRI